MYSKNVYIKYPANLLYSFNYYGYSCLLNCSEQSQIGVGVWYLRGVVF